MDDNIQEERPAEIDATTDDLIQATCTFTFKTYMFCGTKIAGITSNSGTGSGTGSGSDDNSNLSSDNTNQFIPQINMMYMGFYPVPSLSSHTEYIDWVNTLPKDVIKIGVDGNNITTSAEYYPYVDLFSWKFDEFG